MKWVNRFLYSLSLLIAGWLFNFIFGVQFVLGIVTGWLMREGYNNFANMLQKIIN